MFSGLTFAAMTDLLAILRSVPYVLATLALLGIR